MQMIKITLPDVTQEVSLSGEWFAKRDQSIAEANSFTEATAKNADDLGEAVSKLGKMASKIEAERKRLTAPYLAAQKAIKAAVDKAVEPITAEVGRLKRLLAEFAEDERARVAELNRIAELELLAAEAEDAERRANEEELFGSAVEVLNIAPAAPPIAAPKIDGVRLSESVVFEVTDFDAIPTQFLAFDPAKLRAWIAERKEDLLAGLKKDSFVQPVAGIALKIESKVAIR